MDTDLVGFFSYARANDEHDRGKLSQLCKLFEGEISVQLGRRVHLFFDQASVEYGQAWDARIRDGIEAAAFFFPVLTPHYFASKKCRQELKQFLDKAERAGQKDRVIPIYWIEARSPGDALAKRVFQYQYVDFRSDRWEPITGPKIGPLIAKVATLVRDALEPTPQLSEINETVLPQPSQKGEAIERRDPIDHFVGAEGDEFSTIASAIEHAAPGDRILVRDGTYSEPLVLEKALEIIGDGVREQIVLEVSDGDAVLFRSQFGRIANLTIRQAGSEHFAVQVAQGRLELERCDISSRGLACVAIHGGAEPRIIGNRIHHGNQTGVFVYGTASGTIEDNEIFANNWSAVEIADDASPAVRRNRIHGGHAGGVYVNKGSGRIEDNEVSNNRLSGIVVAGSDSASLTIRSNRIFRNKNDGIFITKKSSGVVEKNFVFLNQHSGISVTGASSPEIRKNEVFENERMGIYLGGAGGTKVEENLIYSNRSAGVEVLHGGAASIQRNEIQRNERGLWVHDDGSGEHQGNLVDGNARADWEIDPGCLAFVEVASVAPLPTFKESEESQSAT